MPENPKKIDEILNNLGFNIEARRPYIDDEPDGYLESDNDFVQNNSDSVVALLEGGLQKFAKELLGEALKTIEAQQATGINIEAARAAIEKRFGIDFCETDKKSAASPSP